ncbi:hypothetical protein I3760_02G009900 [Carya illinoinensis]|nr:hypothetical protein I3760_02G009900 [Carya illinoinensis]
MENFQTTLYICVALLVLVACHEVLVIEGRKMKSTEKKQDGNIKENDRSFDNYSTPRQDDDPRPATRLSHIPSNTVDRSVASSKNEIVPPMIPNHSISFRGSESARKDDFRPTAPGNSPGIGHAFPDHEADVALKAIGKSQQGVRHSLNGFKYDYRPTTPGHSPGAGHVLKNKKREPNA